MKNRKFLKVFPVIFAMGLAVILVSSPTGEAHAEYSQAAGSAPVGSTSYSVPNNAVYVVGNESNTGAGTLSNPYGSLGYAVSKADAGSTLVLRGGNYHESVKIPFKKSSLTIQAYPQEEVWLDGASQVTQWARESASLWTVPWTLNFDSKVFTSEGVDRSDWFLSKENPMGGHPDQMWVNDVKQRQVGSRQEVKSGTFFVDKTAKKLYLGSNPSGKRVTSSTLQQGLVIQGVGTTVRGIGLKNYANTYWMGGAISAQVNNIRIENVVSTRNATIGINGWGKNMTFHQVTASENGALGVGLNRADDFTFSHSRVDKNNEEKFNTEPESGGMKVCRSERVVITDNVFSGSNTTGLWFDLFNKDVTVTGNTFLGNGVHGLELELSYDVLVADNYFVNNGSAGIFIIGTSDVEIWNNMFSNNQRYAMRLYQDDRRNEELPHTSLVKNISVSNNVISYGVGSCPYLTDDLLNVTVGNEMMKSSNGNLFHRKNNTTPSNMACWEGASSKIISYKSLQDFQNGTQHDKNSMMIEGAAVLDGNYRLTSAAATASRSVALPIRSDIASVMGVPANSKILGAVSVMGK